MKRTLIALLLLLTLLPVVHAQNFREWFSQKKTQRKYLAEQIAANQVYIEFLQKGYKIAKDGLNAIGSFKRGEFNLHGDYFNSLKNVNPEIKAYARVADIIALQVKVVLISKQFLQQIRKNDAFSQGELDYISRVFGRLLDDCEATLDELISVTSSGKLEMKDDERLARIDKLYLQMQDSYTFAQNFGNEARMIAASRRQDNQDVNTSRAMQGIQNQ